MWEFDPDVKQEIDTATDRGAAISAGAYVERALTASLEWHLCHDPKLFKELTRPEGVFGTFGSKIAIAYMSMLVDRAFYGDLKIIKDIRNDFAHKMEFTTFENDSLRDRVRNISLVSIGNRMTEMALDRPLTVREQFLYSCTQAKVLLGLNRGNRLQHRPIGLPPSPDKS